ncbi:hypothetical protein PIB30_066404 [Stylosanthes scabra]|uniref:Zinc knuckle CX2CX4HX4C domain-containing protein n=1 Tax=Stylosanthes scabra TaxID=79078 RepID=A0ABU6ZL32_9FABA|nr:hypothetical protein [Stylosanthes scabra]
MNIHTPFKKGVNVGNKEDGLCWANLRYEHLPTFCYYCDRMGHDESTCSKVEKDEEQGRVRSKELGPWMKAEQIGRKVEMEKEKEPKGRPQQRDEALERKRKELLTERLMEKLSNLTMVDKSKSTIGESSGHTPATVALEIIPVRRGLKQADKKGINFQESLVELDTQVPKIFKGKKEGEKGGQEDRKGTIRAMKENVVETEVNKNKCEEIEALQDITNTDPTLRKIGGKKWKRYARGTPAPTRKIEDKNTEINKRKLSEGEQAIKGRKNHNTRSNP